jgi:hypothetical protein
MCQRRTFSTLNEAECNVIVTVDPAEQGLANILSGVFVVVHRLAPPNAGYLPCAHRQLIEPTPANMRASQQGQKVLDGSIDIGSVRRRPM